MNEIKLSHYEIKIFKIINLYKKIVDSTINFFDLIIINPIKLIEYVLFKFISMLKISGLVMRYTTIPIHWLWIWWDLSHMENSDIKDLPLFEIGAHYIYAKPGGGKSTLTYHAMMDYAYHSGKCSYTTEMMELPRKDLSGREYYYHQLFEPSDFFQEGNQIAGFDDRRFNMVIYEEMLSKYHQRNNSKNSFNEEVLPMVAAMATQRHQGIDLFYFLSQLPKNDIAIMQMLRGYHEPKIKKVLDYKLWLNTGKIRFVIHGWKMTSYHIAPKNGNDYVLVDKKKWYYKNKYPEDMIYFNRLNMKAKYSELSKMKGIGMNL